jgi:predicted AlkP superfamily pyrophosphatase or phosphodiesterase
MPPLLRRVVCSFALLAAATVSWATPVAGAPAEKPRLLVLLSVDQMRGDYPAQFGHQWTRGLKTLFAKGAHFTNTHFPYLHTVTCAGHVTVGTGAFPNRHGMVFNGWWVEAEKKVIPCSTDAAAHNISYGKPRVGPCPPWPTP